MTTLTVAFCTYKRAERLDELIHVLRTQVCEVPFDILVVNNNSPDNTIEVLQRLARDEGAPLRYVTETTQGIVPARNRAIQESINSDIMVFVDDDELPHPGLLNAAYDAIVNENAQCVGGRVEVDFSPHGRPLWLEDDLLGFLAEVNHGAVPFWIKDASTPVWTANIAYDMRLFRDDPELRFDHKYNRAGSDVGGGEDAVMFKNMLARGVRMRYRPDMAVAHYVEPWRLKRAYFLRLHYRAGLRQGQMQLPEYDKTFMGIPPFMLGLFFKHCQRTVVIWLHSRPGLLRQAMNAAHALGTLVGYRLRQ